MYELNLLILIGISILQIVILLTRDKRIILVGLGIQYVIVFYYVNLIWPLGPSIIKLVAGGMSCVILGLSMVDIPKSGIDNRGIFLRTQIFKGLVGLIVILTVFSLAPRISLWIQGLSESLLVSSVILVAFGFLHIALSPMELKAIVGLLTAISGFEILFSSLENSLLLAGLIAGIHLGLALIGSYLIIHPESGETA